MKFLNNPEVGNVNYTLPYADGSANQILKTDGSGNVSWVTDETGSNFYTSAASFSTTTGELTLTVSGTTNVVVDLDGRYLTAHPTISAATSVNNSGQNFIQDVTLDANGHVTGLASATATGTGDLVDDITNSPTVNVLATYSGTVNTIDYAQTAVSSSAFRIMSDGGALSLCNDTWATRNTGGTSPKYFIHMNPSGAGSPRSAILNDADEFLSIKVPQANAYASFRNANNIAGDELGIMLRSDNDDSTIRIKGIMGGNSTDDETFRIESVNAGTASSHRLHVMNYGDNHFRFANVIGDQPFMFYWGDGTAQGNATNPFATLGIRIDKTTIAVDGTNNPSTPNFRFLDDGDTGMYLAATGQTAFSSGGTKVMSVPTTQGTNGQVLTTDGAGTSSWTTVSGGGGTTYSAGAGLDLTSTTFSVEPDLRDGITHIGLDTTDYIQFTNNARIDFFVNGGNEMRLEADGDLHVDGDVIAFSTTVSDARLKEDVSTIESASEKVSRLRGVEYTWRKGSRKGEREIGLIAQEVEAVIPEIVREKELPLLGDGLDDSATSYKTVDYEKIVALLIESNKELQARIEELEKKIK